MFFQPDYPIDTMRLRLRPFTRGDVDAVYDYRRREDVAQFLADPPMTRAECAEAVQQRTSETAVRSEGDRIVLGVELRETSLLIGEVSLIWRHAEWQQGEIGYVLHPDYRGHGYATEAARAMLKIGFEGMGLHRIIARCKVGNAASARVMERLGMRQEAHFRHHALLKGNWDEEFVYAAIATEWDRATQPSTTLV